MQKVLIITYYWPPSGGSGVQRWLKFSKYLPDFGWKPYVYTPSNPSFDLKDERLVNDIHEETIVWKQPIWEPYSIKDKLFGKGDTTVSSGVLSNKQTIKNRALNWVRGNLFIPDPKKFWIKKSVGYLSAEIESHGITHVVTTGPPHSMHLIGLGLKEKLPHLKWIADFRDPWSELDMLKEFHLSRFALKRHKKLERKVLISADCVLTVSSTWQKSFENKGASNVAMITNGYDSEDILEKESNSSKFIIGHYGLLNHLRNPSNLWRSLNRLCEDSIASQSEFANKLEIHLSGSVDELVVNEVQSYPLLRERLKLLGYLTHDDVLSQYTNASILLLLQFNSTSGVGNYPGKLFEYLAARKPIIAFGPEKSDTSELIQETNCGDYFSYDTEEGIESFVIDIFNKSISFEYNSIEKYSRKNLTKDLAELLSEV